MNWENFSNKCAELLGDNLVGIHLIAPNSKDRVPGADGRFVTIVLMQCDEKTLEKIKEIGRNFYKDETGMDILVCETVDELKELGPYYKAGQLIYAKTIKGKDVAELIEIPSKEELAQDLLERVKYSKLQTKSLITSSGFWSGYLEKGGSYSRINDTLRLATVFYFIQSGEYLTTRDQLRKVGDPDVTLMCNLLDKYKSDSANPHDIEKGLWASLSLLSRFENELKVKQNPNQEKS